MNHIEAYVKDIDDKVAMALKRFAKHEVLHRNLSGGLTVLDFSRPNEVAYSLRIVFDDERGHRAYISGDIGEAVVYPTCPANLMKMAACFTCRNEDGSISVNTDYFLEKCAALSDRYEWDRDDFIDDFKAECAERGIDCHEFLEEHCEPYLGDIEIRDSVGVELSDSAKRDLNDLDSDWWSWVPDCGKRVNGRVILWLVALRLAWEKINIDCLEKEGDAK